MQDLEKRLISVLQLGLQWQWSDVRIESKVETAQEHCDLINRNFPGNDFQPIDPTQERLVFRVYYPKSGLAGENDWQEKYANTFTRSVILILHAFGLGAVTADAEDTRKEVPGYFTFWLARNEAIYQRLPPLIDGQLAGQVVTPSMSKSSEK